MGFLRLYHLRIPKFQIEIPPPKGLGDDGGMTGNSKIPKTKSKIPRIKFRIP